MRTTILAYVIAFMGLVTIAVGVWDLFTAERARARVSGTLSRYGWGGTLSQDGMSRTAWLCVARFGRATRRSIP